MCSLQDVEQSLQVKAAFKLRHSLERVSPEFLNFTSHCKWWPLNFVAGVSLRFSQGKPWEERGGGKVDEMEGRQKEKNKK